MITEQRLQPQIYVVSLSDYNAGRLHGRWIDATQGVDAVQEEVNAMLAESREAVAEEWAIHDYDEFAGVRLGEWEDLARVCELAAALVAHGPAFAAWYSGADADSGVALTIFKGLGYRDGPNSSPGAGEEAGQQRGRYCIRLRRVFTSAVSSARVCLVRLASDRFRVTTPAPPG